MNLPAQQLGATKNRCERIVEVVRDSRCELPKRTQFVGSGRTFTLFFLFSDVTRYAQYTGCAPLDHQRRVINSRVTQSSIVSVITHLISLRNTVERSIKFFTD